MTFSEIILADIASSHIWIDFKLQELSNGTKNTQIGVRMTKLWSYEVEQKNRGLQQRRDFENQRRDVAETEHPDVATLLHNVATFGVGFGWIFSPF